MKQSWNLFCDSLCAGISRRKNILTLSNWDFREIPRTKRPPTVASRDGGSRASDCSPIRCWSPWPDQPWLPGTSEQWIFKKKKIFYGANVRFWLFESKNSYVVEKSLIVMRPWKAGKLDTLQNIGQIGFRGRVQDLQRKKMEKKWKFMALTDVLIDWLTD